MDLIKRDSEHTELTNRFSNDTEDTKGNLTETNNNRKPKN